MLDTLLNTIAPHPCSGCGKIGTLLCDNCKYDIIMESFEYCVACGRQLAGISGICGECRVPYDRAWCIGERRETLQRLIGNFKFTNAKAAYRPLADLLDDRLPILPPSTVIVPVPTVASHIRQRGYDHMLLICRQLAKKRQLPLDQGLVRVTSTKQRDANSKQREQQARQAFAWQGAIDENVPYLVIDDVATTGATLKYAAKTVKDAGAKEVWVAAIAWQPLD